MPIDDCCIEDSVRIPQPELVNLYGCIILGGTSIGAFCEIGLGVIVGRNCKIQARVFIPEGVFVGDNVFIGPGVTFTNVKRVNPYPQADKYETTVVEDGASIGAGATILPGLTIGRNATIGAGAVVTKDVPEGVTFVGNPAQDIAA